MHILLILVLCFLASAKVVLQSSFAKRNALSLKGSIMYNGLAFLVIAVIYMPFVIYRGIDLNTVWYGMAMGACSIIYQLSYTAAFAKGKMALTVIFNNFSMVIPVAISVLWFDEPFGVLRIIGTCLVALSIILNVGGDGDGRKVSFVWILCILITFISNGSSAGVQKIYTKLYEVDLLGFVGISYLTAAALSFAIMPFASKKKLYFPKKAVISACSVGVVLGAHVVLYTYAISIIPGTLLFPAFNCMVSLVMAITGVFLFKEKLSVHQIAGVAVGTLAIILMSI